MTSVYFCLEGGKNLHRKKNKNKKFKFNNIKLTLFLNKMHLYYSLILKKFNFLK